MSYGVLSVNACLRQSSGWRGVRSERIGHVDWELLLPTGFVLLASLGLLCSGLAAYHYLRWERSNDTPRLPVAMAAFALQYGFVFLLAGLSNYSLLRTILMFFTTMALLTAILRDKFPSARRPSDWPR
jgi:hypothetical protein